MAKPDSKPVIDDTPAEAPANPPPQPKKGGSYVLEHGRLVRRHYTKPAPRAQKPEEMN
ncbi:MAG: hypothetical protein KDH19_10940 [Geminicoccaceae bacterium]|nr:hypothetical protein [Geminicoccaceae bacterium]